jgi:hypothetical protein
MKMKNYQEHVSVTICENWDATSVIWLDFENDMYMTHDGVTEKIEKGSKEYKLICKRYAPIFLNNYTEYRQSLKD